ncbi:MAG: PLDc N-terminal domain-containing protein [Burkholderiales bacterium]|nr:PLDc N-terminal domain-containing protein [Burkholderiales bacterium]
MANFWDAVVLLASTFIFVAYLFVLFHIVVDLFRDTRMGGGAKVLWIIFLVFLPVLTALAYILFRGSSMGERQKEALEKAKSQTDQYIREVAGRSPAEEIAQAKSLLDAGTISAEEFARIKAKALS